MSNKYDNMFDMNQNTFQMAKDKLEKELNNCALNTVAEYFKIETLSNNSMSDAIVNALVFLKMEELYKHDIDKHIIYRLLKNNI